MNDAIVVADLSSTQRLVLRRTAVRDEPRIELRKEWRQRVADEWKASKGITIPMCFVPMLERALAEMSHQV